LFFCFYIQCDETLRQ